MVWVSQVKVFCPRLTLDKPDKPDKPAKPATFIKKKVIKSLYLAYLDLFLPGLLLLSLVVANDPVKHLRWKFGVLLLRDVSGF